jgi:hypothetical protein
VTETDDAEILSGDPPPEDDYDGSHDGDDSLEVLLDATAGGE